MPERIDERKRSYGIFHNSFHLLERRCGDLNPGATCATYRISSADPSTTWVHLHSVLYSIGKLMILQVFYRAKFDVFKAVKCKIRDLMFERGDVRIRII